jgi:hypothetical protein
MPTNLQKQAAASSVMQQQNPFHHAKTPITHIKREMAQSIPIPEPPMMEAANPRTRDQQQSSSGVGSLIRTFEGLSPCREQTLKQLVIASVTMTTENLIGLAEELGVKIPKGPKHKGKEKIALYIDKQLAKGKACM